MHIVTQLTNIFLDHLSTMAYDLSISSALCAAKVESSMTIEYVEQLGFDAAWSGKIQCPENFADWRNEPVLLAAWMRGWKKYQEAY